MRHIIQLIVILALIGVGALAFVTMKGCKKTPFQKKDTAENSNKNQKGKPRGMAARPSIRTRVAPLTTTEFTVTIHSQGEVRPYHQTSLTPQVGGRIIKLSARFEDGAYFSRGEVLAEIDSADYLTEITSAEAQLARAKATHAQEQARAKQALLNWKDAGFDEEPSDLVLRKPQLREAQANVDSANASLERAKRRLEYTKVRAPYNGRVRKRNVGLGQQVGPGTTLGEIFSSDTAEVRLPLAPRDLHYYQPPNKPQPLPRETAPPTPSNSVKFTSIINPSFKPSESETSAEWVGHIIRSEGELDPDSRQIFVIARITDPFSLKGEHPALYIGQPLRATIPARTLKNVYIIPRSAMSDLNEIILIRKGKIVHLEISPIWSTTDQIILASGEDTGILPGDQLATSRMPYAPEGAPVEIIASPPPASTSDTPQPGDSRRVGRKKPKVKRR